MRAAVVAAVLIVGLLVAVPMFGLVSATAIPVMDPLAVPVSAAEILTDRSVWWLAGQSWLLAVGAMGIALPLGAGLAWAEARLDFPGRAAWMSACKLTLAVPSYLLAAAVARAAGPAGLGLPTPHGLLPATLLIGVVSAAHVQIVVGSALSRSSAAEEEAARTLGASSWDVLRLVVLPRVRPALGYAASLVLLYAVSDFGAVAVLDCPALTWRLYQAVQSQQLVRAGVLGGILLTICLPLLVLARWLHGAGQARTVANPRAVARTPAGPWGTALAWSASALVVGVGLVVPAVAMGSWVWNGWVGGRDFVAVGPALRDTALLSTAGTLLLLGLSAAPAWVAARARPVVGDAVRTAVWMTAGLPGVLLAFGWLLAALTVARGLAAPGLYATVVGSGVLLGLGLATRFLSEVHAPLESAVRLIDPRQEEAARSLGASTLDRWRFVLLPALRPGLRAAALLGLVAILKELPVTLLLGGATGLHTLAFRVWDRYAEALWHDAGLAGLWLLGLCLVGVWWADRG